MRYYLITLLLIATSCTSVKRHKCLSESKIDNNLVKLDLFGTKVDATKEEDATKSLWDLQAEGQAELIKTLNTRNTTEESFNSGVNKKYLEPEGKVRTDYTTKDLKLIFSISKSRDYANLTNKTSNITLADRIEYLKYTITIPNATNLNFIKWNKYTTEYASVDIADVSFSNSFEINGALGQSGTKTVENKAGADENNYQALTNVGSFTPSVSGKGTFSRTENQKIKYRYLQLHGTLSDKVIQIEEEGMREIDLTGNVIADLNLKFDETTEFLSIVENLKTGVLYNTPDKLKLNLRSVLVPSLATLPATIDATLAYEYAYRHVEKGESTFFEWDDKVSYITGKATKTISLFRKKDYLPDFFNISKIGEDAVLFANRARIVIEDANQPGTTYELAFQSLPAASAFWEWLRTFSQPAGHNDDPIKIGNFNLKYRLNNTDRALTKTLLASVQSTLNVLPYFR